MISRGHRLNEIRIYIDMMDSINWMNDGYSDRNLCECCINKDF